MSSNLPCGPPPPLGTVSAFTDPSMYAEASPSRRYRLPQEKPLVAKYTLLELIKQVDSVPYHGGDLYKETVESAYAFRAHNGTVLGLILPFVAEQLKLEDTAFMVDHASRSVSLLPSLDTEQKRTKAIGEIVNKWRENRTFKVLEGWRDELYVVYNPSHTSYFLIERCSACLFGVVTYGIHLTGYMGSCADELEVYVPRRSFNKPTYPGMLDNTVAGGIGHPCGVIETVYKECAEEAGLSQDVVSYGLNSAGVVTYMHQAAVTLESEKGVYQPEVEFIFDLKLDRETYPRPVDGEVHEFEIMTPDYILECLRAGEFKYNSALVMIDFMIRHGIITPENEPDYVEIVERCHRKLPYPLM